MTVVIPCFNYGRYLEAAIRSALCQNSVDCRIIIVDDRSTDDSLPTALRLASDDGRVKVIAHDQNRGHIQTYNDGLAAVDTEYFTLVSADDALAPGALDRAIALMERFPRVGLVYGKVVRFSHHFPVKKSSLKPGLWEIWRGRDWIRRVVTRGYNPIISSEATVRTEVLREIGGYNPELPHAGDLEYWLRAAIRWDVGRIMGVTQAYYRVHGANMHLTKFDSSLDNIRQKLAAFQVLRTGQAARADVELELMYQRGVATLIDEALNTAEHDSRLGPDGDRELASFALTHAMLPDQRERARQILRKIDTGVARRIPDDAV